MVDGAAGQKPHHVLNHVEMEQSYLPESAQVQNLNTLAKIVLDQQRRENCAT